jgi:pimeloyl-ACP methyl ester carboxylesterase
MPTLNLNGANIFYNEYGKEQKGNHKPHLLFIHGLGSSSLAWRDIPEAFSGNFHTIAVDLIGFGGSDKPEKADYTINGFSSFIADFLRKGIHIGKNEKISILGHSLGGYIASEVAIDNNELIEKIILTDSSGMLDGPTPLLRQYLAAATEINPIIRYDKLKRVFEDMYASPSRLLPLVIDLFNYVIEKPGAKHAFESAYFNSTTTKIGRERLMRIKDIPCLIIWGTEDNLIPIEYADRFTQVLRQAKFEKIEDAGHSPFVEKTAKVYERLRSFLME